MMRSRWRSASAWNGGSTAWPGRRHFAARLDPLSLRADLQHRDLPLGVHPRLAQQVLHHEVGGAAEAVDADRLPRRSATVVTRAW